MPMERDACIKVVVATHRVAGSFLAESKIGSLLKESANNILADMMLVLEQNPITRTQKLQIIPRTVREIEILFHLLDEARAEERIDKMTSQILQNEYGNIRDHLKAILSEEHRLREQRDQGEQRPFVREREGASTSPKKSGFSGQDGNWEREEKATEAVKAPAPKQPRARARKLSERQERILALLEQKERIQIWELQKVLPNVTKRTLRRDMDDLLSSGLIQREGEWNSVAYRRISSR